MSKAADTGEPAGELERLIADLSGSGELVFVFGDGLTTAHLADTVAPEFRGPAGRRWWHARLGDDAAIWTMSVRVDQITGVRFFREPYPFQPHFPGQEVLGEQFLGQARAPPCTATPAFRSLGWVRDMLGGETTGHGAACWCRELNGLVTRLDVLSHVNG